MILHHGILNQPPFKCSQQRATELKTSYLRRSLYPPHDDSLQ
ncbi:MAG: hypothetical protein OJF50_001462 [Nitrospira sp.]|nr:hypothetical protein [Nitrospira sp.]